jgi:hypothetical protein
MSFAMTSRGPTRGQPRVVARVIAFHFRVCCPTRCFASSPLCTRGLHGGLCRSQQSIIHAAVAHRYESHYRMQNRMYEHALGRGSTGFRVPRANSTRLQPCLRHSALQASVRALSSADWPGNCFCPAQATSTADNGISDNL